MENELAQHQKGNGGTTVSVRQEFGAVESRQQFETAATAVAARQQALVQARFVVALQRPRDVDEFRVRLLKECKRPGFAEMAEYSRPVGKEYNHDLEKWEEKIAHGPSVHLIRTALAIYRNIDADSMVVFENQETRVTHTYVLDLETNVGWGRTLTISKIVEKRGFKGRHGKVEPPKGRDILGERINSAGDTVFICSATEDETRIKEANLVAKAQRENGRSLLPRDMLDEAIQKASETLADADRQDPDAAKKKLVDSFAGVNVSPADLAEYLGHPVNKITPAELNKLRKLFVSLREGEVSWTDLMAEENPVGSAEASQKVAADKLARMGAPGNEIPPTNKVKGETGGGSGSRTGETEARPAQAETSATAGDPSSAPELTEEEMRRQQAEAEQPKEQTGRIKFGAKK